MTKSPPQNTKLNARPTMPARDSPRAALPPGPVLRSVHTSTGRRDLPVLAAPSGRHPTRTLGQPPDGLPTGLSCQDLCATGKHGGIQKSTRTRLGAHLGAALRLRRPPLLPVHHPAAPPRRHDRRHHAPAGLATTGWDARWQSAPACNISTTQRSKRVFLLAWFPPAPATTTGGGYGCPPPTPARAIIGEQATPPVTAPIRDDGR
jgi:hypothetical protein